MLDHPWVRIHEYDSDTEISFPVTMRGTLCQEEVKKEDPSDNDEITFEEKPIHCKQAF